MSEYLPVPSEREWTPEERNEFFAGSFVESVISLSESHPDENDPFWEEFWRLKSSKDQL